MVSTGFRRFSRSLCTAAFLGAWGLVALAFMGSTAHAGIRLIEAGIVCPRPTEGELVQAPGTEAGVIRKIKGSLFFDLNGRTVPTLDELSFGFRTGLKPGTPPQDVTIVVTHPPMGPRGIEREEWSDVLMPGVNNLNLFTFEHDYEKVPGDWTFAIEVDGQPVVSVAFQVTDTGGDGSVEETCFQFLS
ncbi:MAG: DUF3859 domain-containing protein [Pseudomonadota bacterium]